MTLREEELTRQNELLRQENALLRQKIDLLVKRVFGASSEQLDRNQLELLTLPESAAAAAVAVVASDKERSKSSPQPRVARLPENLPVVEEVIDPEPVKAQPEAWRCIGQKSASNWITSRADSSSAEWSAANMCLRPTLTVCPLSPLCRNGCWIAVCPRRGCWPISWWENIATIFLFTVKNRFTGSAMESTCRVKV